MAAQGNFAEVMDEVFCSPQAAENGMATLVVEKMYEKIDIDKYFTMVAPVRTGDAAVSLMYPAVYNAIKNTESTGCGISSCDISPEYSAKKWTIALAECRFPLCTRGLDEKFLAFWNSYKRVNPESDEYQFILDQVSDMLADLLVNTLLAKIWFSDTTFQLTPGAAADTMDGIDGIFAQTTADGTNAVVIPDTVDMTDGEEIYNQIKAAIVKYQESKFRKSLSESAIYIDELDAIRVVAWLNDIDRKGGVDCLCVDPNGVVRADAFTVEGLTIAGLPVYTQPFRDMMEDIPEYQQNNELIYPHYFLIAPKGILLVGSGNADDLHELDHFYDRKDRTHYWDIGYTYGVSVASNHFVYGLQTADISS